VWRKFGRELVEIKMIGRHDAGIEVRTVGEL
jgi:hypothetical protein